jgi:hypothetical protein
VSPQITRLSFNQGELRTIGRETIATWRLFRTNHQNVASVFRINGLDESEIWSYADEHFDRENQTMCGRGDLSQADVEGVGLELEMNEEPPRHGEIRGWPEKGTPKHKELAEDLASRCRGVFRPG